MGPGISILHDFWASLVSRPGVRGRTWRRRGLAGLLLLGGMAMAATVFGAEAPPFYPDKQNLMVVRDGGGRERPVTGPAEWAKRREHILANMQLAMGPLPDASKGGPLDVRIEEDVRLDGLVRRKITYAGGDGDRVPAYLFLPGTPGAKRPAMLCLHQTIGIGKGEPAGLGGSENLHYALELARRGYVTLAPDYPNFGEYSFDPYAHGYVSATMKGIRNHRRAADLLQSLPEVDRERIGCIGHSLGGHNTLFVAAFDPRIRVAVTSCGFNSFRKYMGGDLTGWSHKGYMPRIADLYGKDPAKMPFDFTEILGALAPRALFINAPVGDNNFEVSGVSDCLQAAAPVYRLLGAPDRLVAVHPECGHDFPPEVRRQAYEFVDSVLR